METADNNLNSGRIKNKISDKITSLEVEIEKINIVLESALHCFEDIEEYGKGYFVRTPNILNSIAIDYLINLQNGLNELSEIVAKA